MRRHVWSRNSWRNLLLLQIREHAIPCKATSKTGNPFDPPHFKLSDAEFPIHHKYTSESLKLQKYVRASSLQPLRTVHQATINGFAVVLGSKDTKYVVSTRKTSRIWSLYWWSSIRYYRWRWIWLEVPQTLSHTGDLSLKSAQNEGAYFNKAKTSHDLTQLCRE